MRLEDIKTEAPKLAFANTIKPIYQYDREAIAEYAKNHTCMETADHFGCSASYVTKVNQELNPRRPKRHKTPDHKIAEIKRMAANGCKPKEIAEITGVSVVTCRKWIRSAH